MPTALRIAVVGDFDRAFRPHVATDAALVHAAEALGLEVGVSWVPTAGLEGLRKPSDRRLSAGGRAEGVNLPYSL